MGNKQGTIENKERFDDGSLDFLQIPADETNKQFNCKETLIRKGIKKNFCRAAARLNKRNDISAAEYKQRLCSWFGWAKVCNSKHLLKTIIKPQFYETCILR